MCVSRISVLAPVTLVAVSKSMVMILNQKKHRMRHIAAKASIAVMLIAISMFQAKISQAIHTHMAVQYIVNALIALFPAWMDI